MVKLETGDAQGQRLHAVVRGLVQCEVIHGRSASRPCSFLMSAMSSSISFKATSASCSFSDSDFARMEVLHQNRQRVANPAKLSPIAADLVQDLLLDRGCARLAEADIDETDLVIGRAHEGRPERLRHVAGQRQFEGLQNRLPSFDKVAPGVRDGWPRMAVRRSGASEGFLSIFQEGTIPLRVPTRGVSSPGCAR